MGFPAASKWAAEVGLTDRELAVSTWWRWTMTGCRGHRLETVMVGGRRCVRPSAIRDFLERITAASEPEPRTPISPPVWRRKRHEQAEREAEAMGL